MTRAPSIAIEGAGHLAAALIEGFCRAAPVEIALRNRTPERAQALVWKWPSIAVPSPEAFDSGHCPLLFAIPGTALLELSADRIARFRAAGRALVSCVNGLPLDVLDACFPGLPWIKAIPSVTAATGQSVTLLARGASADCGPVDHVTEIFNRVGTTIELPDAEIDRLSIATSCFPGLLAAILDEFARSLGLEPELARRLLPPSTGGAVQLAARHPGGFAGLVGAVANSGGLTEAGVEVLRSELPAVFARVRTAMERRIEERAARYRESD